MTNSRLIRDQMLLGGIGNCLVSVFNWLREKTTSLRDRLLVRSCICICSALVLCEGRPMIMGQVNFVNICFNLRFLIIMANVSSVKSFLHVYALNEFLIIIMLLHVMVFELALSRELKL